MKLASENSEHPHGKISQKLLNEIETKFFVKQGFASAYLEEVASKFDLTQINSIEELYKLTPLAPIHWDYALSTINRGRFAAYNLAPIVGSSLSHKKYLDVGCAYGGYLIAFREKGFEVKGIELIEYLARLGKINCRDHGIPEEAVIYEDFLEYDLDKLGKFDLVTCNDVIEHVQNTELTLKKLSMCLSEGGILYFEIPNKNHIPFINKDGHFNLFGINLLKHYTSLVYLSESLPDEYANMKKDFPKNLGKGMGEFFDIAFYVDWLEKYGLSVSVEIENHLIGDLEDVPQMMNEVVNSFNDFYNNREKYSYFVSEELIENYFQYISELSKDYLRAKYYGERKQFLKKYMTSFWTIIAKKEVSDQSSNQNKIKIIKQMGIKQSLKLIKQMGLRQSLKKYKQMDQKQSQKSAYGKFD